MMTTRDQPSDQVCRAIQKLVLFISYERDFTVMFECEKHRPVSRENARGILTICLVQPRRATQCQQRVIRYAAQRRTKHSSKRELISLVIEESQQLDEIGYFFALVEAATENCLVRNVRAPKCRLVDRNKRHCAKQQSDVAIAQTISCLHQRLDSVGELLCIAFARFRFAQILFTRLPRCHQQFDERTSTREFSLGLAAFVVYITKLAE